MPTYRPDLLMPLCQALLPEDPSLAAEVALASRDPSAYYAQFEERLSEDRGMGPEKTASPEFAWIALLYGLYYRQRLVEVDWRADAESVMEDIDLLLHDPATVAGRWDWVEALHGDTLSTELFLQAVGDWQLRQGRMLAHLYESSDSYPLMIIDPGQLSELQSLARHSGYGDIQPLDSAHPDHFELPWLSEP